MKILYLVHRIPYPPDKGDKIRSCHQVEYLAERHDVWCAFFVDHSEDWQHVETLRRRCRHVAAIGLSRKVATIRGLGRLLAGGTLSEGFFWDRRMIRVVRDWSASVDFDAALVFSSSMAPYKRFIRARRTVLDLCDWNGLKWAGYAEGTDGSATSKATGPGTAFLGAVRRRLFRLEAKRLLRREIACLSEFDACTVVTQAEADAVDLPAGTPAPHVVCNGAEPGPEPTLTADAAPARIGFVGQMDYPPNVEAVRWFADEVFPRVRHRVPEATFQIVGRSPSRLVRALGDRDAIEVTGEVVDIRKRLEGFAVSVAPLRVGRGVQNKVLEAMSASRPVVLSSPAAAGIDAVDGEHVIIADDPTATGDTIISLLQNPARRSAIGRAARARVVQRYSWPRELAKLEALMLG